MLGTRPDITSTPAPLCRHAANHGFGPLYALIRHLRRTADYKLESMVGASYSGSSCSQGAPSLWVSSSTVVSPFPWLWPIRSGGRTPSHGVETRAEVRLMPVPCRGRREGLKFPNGPQTLVWPLVLRFLPHYCYKRSGTILMSKAIFIISSADCLQ